MKKKTKSKAATQQDIKLLERKLVSKIETLRKESQEDLELMGGNLTFQIDEMREEQAKQGNVLENVITEQAKQSRVLGDILSVNQAILGQLGGMQNHGNRIENHEERITDVEVQVRMLRR